MDPVHNRTYDFQSFEQALDSDDSENNDVQFEFSVEGKYLPENNTFSYVKPDDLVTFAGSMSKRFNGAAKVVSIVETMFYYKRENNTNYESEIYCALVTPLLDNNAKDNEVRKELFKEELALLSQLQGNDFIISLFASSLESSEPFMLQEAADRDLYDFLTERALDDSMAFSLITQIKNILNYLTSKDLVWLDAKPENFVVFYEGLKLKAIDIGFSANPKDPKTKKSFSLEWISVDYFLKCLSEHTNFERLNEWIKKQAINFSLSNEGVHHYSYFAMTHDILETYASRKDESRTYSSIKWSEYPNRVLKSEKDLDKIQTVTKIFLRMDNYKPTDLKYFKGTSLEEIASHMKDLCQWRPEKRIEMGEKYGLGKINKDH